MGKVELYPLKFTPILKSPLWGGTKLGSRLNKNMDGLDICGESWEISGVDGNISIVTGGVLAGKNLVELIDIYKHELTGHHCYSNFGNKFPLLIKFIDANQDLSIQVHPNDTLAKERHNSFGKTEMWYVVDAEEDATLISGFNKATSKEEYLEYFNSGRITELLNKEDVQKDDVFFLPAGRVHTIGKGLVIAEIQQTSDVTYRIFDFDRLDKQGNKRELHIEEAVEAIDYNYYEDYNTSYDRTAKNSNLVTSKYFITNRLILDAQETREYGALDSFKIIMCIEGAGFLETNEGSFSYLSGDTYLIPANIRSLGINPSEESKILEVYLPS